MISYHHVPTPPPCSLTPLLSSTSTFLLRSCLSSGLMTFSLAFLFPSSPSSTTPLLPGRLRPSTADVAPEFRVLGEEGLSAGLRWRMVGVGKLFRLSTASTVRWKRRKRAWARRRVEGRSIVLESSLTVRELIRILPRVYYSRDKHTVFQDLVKTLQMLHDDVSMLFQDCQCDKEMEITTHIICPQRLP